MDLLAADADCDTRKAEVAEQELRIRRVRRLLAEFGKGAGPSAR